MKLKSREKILVVFVFIAIAVWGFDRFYYTPQNRKILQLKEEIKAADRNLLLKETLEAKEIRLEKELKGLSERTLNGEELRVFLRHLAGESNVLPMKIISLTSLEEKLSSPEGKKESTSQYRKVTIQMVLHSTYTQLGTYLKDIGKLPFLANIDSLQVERNEGMSPLLKVTMGLSMYIVTL